MHVHGYLTVPLVDFGDKPEVPSLIFVNCLYDSCLLRLLKKIYADCVPLEYPRINDSIYLKYQKFLPF